MSYVNVVMYLMSIPRSAKTGNGKEPKKIDLRGKTEATFKMLENLKRNQ
jgi:hypothetical protein